MAADADEAELSAWWSLSLDELALIETKPPRSRLGFAAQLKLYRRRGRFAERASAIPAAAVHYLAEQVDASPTDLAIYEWTGRSGRRHREEILTFLGIRRMAPADRQELTTWIEKEICPTGTTPAVLIEQVYAWCLDRKIQSPTARDVERLVRSVAHRFETAFLERMAALLAAGTAAKLEEALAEPEGTTGFHGLKADPGRIGLESILTFADRLAFLRSLKLPHAALTQGATPLLEQFRRRVGQETAWEMRRHPSARRLGLLAIFLAHREREITDRLVDLLIETIHKFSSRAERKVVSTLTNEVQKVHGKERLLVRIAEAAIERPDDAIREVIFPVADEATLAAVIRDYRAGGSFQRRVYTTLRASYSNHYRRMLPKLLDVLEFRSNNATHRPVLDALAWIRRTLQDGRRILRLEDGLPMEDVIPAKWRGLVLEEDGDGGQRINRINYEICVLMTLRERLRCKEIWVVGADRYRNPDEDLPLDFEARRSAYYTGLNLTLDATAFTEQLRATLTAALTRLNREIPDDPQVRLLQRGGGRISLSPLLPLPEPPNLEAVKAAIERLWPMTGLLDVLKDVLKEAALKTGFLDRLTTSADRVALDPQTLHRRLLLCLYALGTNAGLKRVSAGQDEVSYKELLQIRRRFLHKDGLRAAIAHVVNAILAIRDPAIWGEATASCASDSKKFPAWDQNLITEWHIRYGGRGVMIYWHVERRAACIYSQLKRCSSSEVTAMIEGVLRHCTDAEIDRHYVDSHGQSEVAFAFCHLLGFTLAPRLKAIARQKLYLPDRALKDSLPHLALILTRAIDWDLIARQYDEMVKYTAALRHRTADPEAILRRFTRTTVQHPTYKALAELGKVIKTIFLCHYLGSEPFRREIHHGLNVVENWNSANGFIFFGKGGEVATNRIEDQETSVLALHLLQNCLVYVNTLMMQRVLTEPTWAVRMTTEDYRGLTPLIYAHVNPYGRFDLDLDHRIDFDRPIAA